MIVNIIGGSGSGKTTLKIALGRRGFHIFAPLTTRPIRKGELDGVHYRFVTEAEFLSDETIVLSRQNGEGYWYGNRRDDLFKEGVKTVTTMNVDGILSLESFGLLVRVIFLDIPQEIRRERMIKRGDELVSIEKRLHEDKLLLKRLSALCFKSAFLRLSVASVDELVQQVESFVL